MDLSGKKGRGGTKELVLTVPPSRDNYYVVNLLDGFINSIGSIGTRTTPSTKPQTYLLAGPTSRYAHRRTARIDGFRYRVMASDTNLNWMLIRIRADSLVPPSDPASTASISSERRRAIRHEHAPPSSRRADTGRSTSTRTTYTPTAAAETAGGPKWHNAPTHAVRVLQAGGPVAQAQPAPHQRGRGSTAYRSATLPSWVVPQAGAKTALPQPGVRTEAHAGALQADRPHGERVQGPERLAASRSSPPCRKGFKAGKDELNEKLSPGGRWSRGPTTGAISTPTSGRIPTPPGVHLPRDHRARRRLGQHAAGRRLRPDQQPRGTRHTQLDGNNTYRLTFRPPGTNLVDLPAIGSLPPTVNDSQRQSARVLVDPRLPDRSRGVGRPVHHPAERPEHGVLDREPRRDRRRRRRPTPSRSSRPHGARCSRAHRSSSARPRHSTASRRACPTTSSRTRPKNPDGTYSFQVSTEWRQDAVGRRTCRFRA